MSRMSGGGEGEIREFAHNAALPDKKEELCDTNGLI